jgi:L-alanine-DL-glutamate epimerase-like enolase superfamily enzyme
MKITDIALIRFAGHWTGAGYPAGERQAMALDIYPEFNRQTWMQHSTELRPVHAIYVEIRTEEVSGLFGPIEEEQAYIIHKFLRPFLVGRDALATETLLDQMLRMHRHGRSGLFMTGVSAVDCALWDLKGKAFSQPVYRLLGGPTRPSVPAYASMLGFPIMPEQAASTAAEYKNLGYPAQKWFFRYGPADGTAGKEKNLAMAQAVRQAVGEHYPLMFDAFMGWDTSYAIEMGRALVGITPTWLEEPIPPERVMELRKIRQQTGIPIATGEHVYTRWQVKELLTNQAVDYMQADPDWCGGLSELVKIATLCSSFEVPLVAHGHSLLAALHLAGAQSPGTIPYVEYLIQHQAHKQYFHKQTYQPQNGSVRLPESPGLGIKLDESRIESRTEVVF